MQLQPPRRDVTSESTCGVVEHRFRHLNTVDPARLTDTVEEKLQPNPAAEADIGEHRRWIRLERLHGGAYEVAVSTIQRGADQPPTQTTGVTELSRDSCHKGAPYVGHLKTVPAKGLVKRGMSKVGAGGARSRDQWILGRPLAVVADKPNRFVH